MQRASCFIAIEQHGDAVLVDTPADNNANPLSKARTTNSSKLTHLEAGSDWDLVCSLIHRNISRSEEPIAFFIASTLHIRHCVKNRKFYGVGE
jgi:hypothetical protein